MNRSLRLLVFIALLLVPIPKVSAQADWPVRRFGVSWNSSAPTLDFNAGDVVRARVHGRRIVEDRLTSGRPATLVISVVALSARDNRPLATYAATCRVTFAIWEETFRVEYQRPGADRTEHAPNLERVRDRCLAFTRSSSLGDQRIQVGSARDFRRLRGQRVYFAVRIELNPLSETELRRLRRMISRPDDEGSLAGPFVARLVSRNISSAEYVRRFRSQVVSVP